LAVQKKQRFDAILRGSILNHTVHCLRCLRRITIQTFSHSFLGPQFLKDVRKGFVETSCQTYFSDSRITMDIYTQALTPAKREAQSRIANLILPKRTIVGESLTNPFKLSSSEAGSAN